jgi:A/G-specific adenine glycosylase
LSQVSGRVCEKGGYLAENKEDYMKKKEKVSPGSGFSTKLLRWDRNKNFRQMPWKGEKNPYKIWLSEIILQQTRVEQGLNYYRRFIETFPDIHSLASAPEQKIFKLWEGLGYYSRCRNLIATARYISRERGGVFPEKYEEIKALKGIGPYTAAAISSFAFNLPYAVVDGNVFRILSRIFGIAKPIDSTEGKKYFFQVADDLLNKKQPGVYNQAIMDFGAVICKPVSPLCNSCVFNKTCYAFLNKKVNQLPVKEKKIKIRKRWFYYLVIEFEKKIAVNQRNGKDIWQQLYEFPLIESNEEQDIENVLLLAEKKAILQRKGYELTEISPLFKQQLSHQLITGQFIKVKKKNKKAIADNFIWENKKKIHHYPFPKFINQYLEKK